jgi:hypothetical protein
MTYEASRNNVRQFGRIVKNGDGLKIENWKIGTLLPHRLSAHS